MPCPQLSPGGRIGAHVVSHVGRPLLRCHGLALEVHPEPRFRPAEWAPRLPDESTFKRLREEHTSGILRRTTDIDNSRGHPTTLTQSPGPGALTRDAARSVPSRA
jgi:hypothetical protein